jgi:hypothetical protein
MDARLDQTTRQIVDDLAKHFHTPRATVLCHIMQWGLNRKQREPITHGEAQGPVCHLSLYVPSDLHEQVQKAATAAGVKLAAWLRHMVRQVTIEDFPTSWQEATPTERSHDSRTYGRRFMLRLDDPTLEKLEELSSRFDTSAAEVIRHLIAQATPEDFPQSWHRRAKVHHVQRGRRNTMGQK